MSGGRAAQRPPRLFGAYRRMPLLIAMVENGGFIRRMDIADSSGKKPVDDLLVSDKSGLLLQKWRYRAHHYMVSFNPDFPLLPEVFLLLKALARYYPSGLANVVPREDRVIPNHRPRRSHNVDYSFGSPTRTQTLAALEALGGKAWQNNIHRGVPGQAHSSVKNVVAYFVCEGVLEKRGCTICFRRQPWLLQLRKLLRAYLRVRSDFHNRLEKALALRTREQRGLPKLDLLASPPVQRCLMALATHGPMGPTRLFAKAATVSANGTLDIFRREGIIAIRKGPRARVIGLNAAYPVYRELRALLLRMGGGCTDIAERGSDFTLAKATFSPRRLFTSELRSEVLIVVNTSKSGGISASSIRRLLPEYDLCNLRSALRKFVRQGILRSRRDGVQRLYSLNPRYPVWRELKMLLDAVAEHWPSYRTIAGIEDRLGRRHAPAR